MGLVLFLRRVVLGRKCAATDRIAAVDFEEGMDHNSVGFTEYLSWDDVQKLSMDFSRVIGYGGFTTVYLARFSGAVAAVKRYSASQRLYQLYKQELEILQRLHHHNIVKLLGYSDVDDREEGVLILEYIPNGNLQEKLHGPKALHLLPWKRRMAIAFQLAQAVSYLHDTCTPHIIHGDIKPSNILLDSSLNCKLCDFGSAKMGFSAPPDADVPRLSRNNRKLMMGSPGYTDPVYIKTGLASKKNDIYGLGVVILELITGMEAINPESGERLAARAESMLRDTEKVGEMVDRRLNGEVDSEEARAMVGVAAKCVCGSASTRPNASDIVEIMRSQVCSSLSSL